MRQALKHWFLKDMADDLTMDACLIAEDCSVLIWERKECFLENILRLKSFILGANARCRDELVES